MYATQNPAASTTPITSTLDGNESQVNEVTVCRRRSATVCLASFTTPGVFYAVQVTPDVERCTCPAYRFRSGTCKHIAKVRNQYICTWDSATGTLQTERDTCPECGHDTATLPIR